MIKPRQPVPELSVPVVDGGHWTLSERAPQCFAMIVAYRGLHCPICRAYLSELDRLHSQFVARGVDVLAVSADDGGRAERAVAQWGLQNLAVGHSLPIDVARNWGLYVSRSRGPTSAGIEEPSLFTEPGVFVVRPDRTLYFAAVQTMPFARPHFDELLRAIDFVVKNDYPARGEA
ncbi:MAG: peroxiredoxin-like family protein [Pseudomonadota bacterium]